MSSSFNFFALTQYAGKAPTAPSAKSTDTKKRRRAEPSVLGSVESTRKRKKRRANRDPSAKYLENPLKCPIVREFRSFFASVCETYGIPAARVHIGPRTGWRSVAKLSARSSNDNGKRGAPVIGIFEPKSHNVIELLHSDAHHPAINKAMKHVSKSAVRVGIVGYNGKDHGGLSYVSASVDLLTNCVQLVLVFNASGKDEVGSCLDDFINDLASSHQWHSIWCHFHKASRHDNSIFGREGSTWTKVHGTSDPVAAILNLPSSTLVPPPTLHFPPQVFRQANLEGFTRIIREIRKWMNPRGNESGRANKCVELYGGVGTIGLNVLDLVEALSCSDANPFNEKCFARSCNSLSNSDSSRAHYTTGGAADMANSGELRGPIDVVIVDPPRKGLDVEVLDAMMRENICRIIYVSCGFKAFGRDYKRLSSRYKVVHAEGHVLFPGSNHIETLCIFDRKDFNGTGRKVSVSSSPTINSLSGGASSCDPRKGKAGAGNSVTFEGPARSGKKKRSKKKTKKKKKKYNSERQKKD